MFAQADIFGLPFGLTTFDHVFVCFVLEHLPRPVDALVVLKEVLKPGGNASPDGWRGRCLLLHVLQKGRAKNVNRLKVDA